MFNRKFRRYIDSSTPTVEVNYTSNDFLIKKITISKKDQRPGNKYYRDSLDIECVNTPEGNALADRIASATKVVILWEGTGAEEKALRRNFEKFFTKYTTADEVKRLVNVLHETVHNDAPIIDENMRDQLLEDMDIKVYCDDIHAIILAEANTNVGRGKELAFQHHREYGYREILWLLAEHFRQKDLLGDAVEMYEAIPNDNKHYAESRLQLRSIYQEQLTANQMGEITLTSEEIQTIREKLLELSLLAGDHTFSTGMFYDLSGSGLMANAPQIKLNGNNPETFILLAQQIAQLNKEKQKLQHELAELKKYTLNGSTNMNLAEQSAACSGVTQPSYVIQTSSQVVNTPPMSLYAASSPALYAQPSPGNSANINTTTVTDLGLNDDQVIRNVMQ